jgi:hypothetical protein
MHLLRYIYVDFFLTARRASPARRRSENAQAASRGAEQVPVDAVGAPRHAAHRTRIIRPTCLGSCDVVLFCALAFQQFFLSLCGPGLYLRREDYMHGWVHVGMVLRIVIRHHWLFSEGVDYEFSSGTFPTSDQTQIQRTMLFVHCKACLAIYTAFFGLRSF